MANSIATEEALFWSSLLSRCTGEPGTRRRGDSFKDFILTEIAGDKLHTGNDVKTRQRHGEN